MAVRDVITMACEVDLALFNIETALMQTMTTQKDMAHLL